MKYDAIDEKASQLGRALTTFNMLAAHEVPAVILNVHVEIIHRVSGELHEMLTNHPDAEVTVSTRLNEGMERLYRDSLAPGEVPDSLPPDWMED